MSEEVKKMEFCEVFPATDIVEEEKSTSVIIEVPGVNAQHVSVEVDHQIMNVEAKSWLVRNGEQIVYKRSFQLSDAVDVDHITAKTQDGILTLCLPKSERAQVHRITVE